MMMMMMMMMMREQLQYDWQAHTSYLWDPVRKVLDLTKVKDLISILSWPRWNIWKSKPSLISYHYHHHSHHYHYSQIRLLWACEPQLSPSPTALIISRCLFTIFIFSRLSDQQLSCDPNLIKFAVRVLLLFCLSSMMLRVAPMCHSAWAPVGRKIWNQLEVQFVTQRTVRTEELPILGFWYSLKVIWKIWRRWSFQVSKIKLF